jgi:hypothetical protein
MIIKNITAIFILFTITLFCIFITITLYLEYPAHITSFCFFCIFLGMFPFIMHLITKKFKESIL